MTTSSLPFPFPRALVALPLLAVVLLCMFATGPVQAATPPKVPFDIPAGPADQALREFTRQSSTELIFSTESARSVRTNAVQGEFSPDEALNRLIAGTSLRAERGNDDGVIRIVRSNERNDDARPVPARAPRSDPGTSAGNEDTVSLSPFVVESSNPDEYVVESSTGATRIRTPLQDIPVHISVVTDELLRDTASFQLDEAVDYLGGVARSSTQGYNIRGFGSGNSLRNGIRTLSKPDTSLIQRVEVVKGPAALLYGTSEPGGVLNYVTKRPGVTPRSRLLLSAGSNSFFRAELESTGALGGNDRLRYLVSLTRHQTDFAPRYREDHRNTASAILEWQPTPDTTLSLRYSFQRSDQIGNGGLPFKPGNHPDRQSNDPDFPVWVAELGPRYGKDSPYSWQDQEDQTWEFEVTQRVGADLNLRLLAGYFISEGQRIREGSTALNAGTYVPGVRGLRTTSWLGEILDEDENLQVQADAVLNRSIGPFEGQFLIGAEYGENNDRALSGIWADPNNLIPATPGFSRTGPDRQVRFTYDVFDQASIDARDAFAAQYLPSIEEFLLNDSYGDLIQENQSAYANTQLTWNENRGRLMAGVRYDRVTIDNRTVSSADNVVTSTSEGETDRYTPQVGVSYKIRPALSLYALYSQSVKPRFSLEPTRTAAAEQRLIDEATAAGLPAPDPDTLPWGRLRDPEYGEGYELGLKWNAAQRRASGTVSLFHIEKLNAVSAHSNPILQAVGFRELGGVDRVMGVDMDVHWEPLPGLTVLANYAYLDSEAVKNDNPNFVGRPLFEAPEHQGGVWTRYRFGETDRAYTVGLGVTAMDKRRADPSPFAWSASWYRVDVQMGMRTRLLGRAAQWNLNLKNLTNESYFDQRDTPAQGFTAILTLRWDL